MNLAHRLRPQTLEDYVGQEQLVGTDKILRKMIEQGTLSSMIFWGPPGSGKTTLAHLLAKATNAHFHQLSGVTSGKKDLMEVIEKARNMKGVIPSVVEGSYTTHQVKKPQVKIPPHASISRDDKNQTILFIDEIHRWNKAQQDALLPYVENGTITLIGATTENPSFEIISALLSRSRVFVLKSLEKEQLQTIIKKAFHLGFNQYDSFIKNQMKMSDVQKMEFADQVIGTSIYSICLSALE